MFALFMEPYAMIQLSLLPQPHRTVVEKFVPGNFGLFWRNPGNHSADLFPQDTGWKMLLYIITLQFFHLLNWHVSLEIPISPISLGSLNGCLYGL